MRDLEQHPLTKQEVLKVLENAYNRALTDQGVGDLEAACFGAAFDFINVYWSAENQPR